MKLKDKIMRPCGLVYTAQKIPQVALDQWVTDTVISITLCFTSQFLGGVFYFGFKHLLPNEQKLFKITY